MTRRWRRFAGGLVVAAVSAGCGAGDTTTDTTNATDPSATASTVSTPGSVPGDEAITADLCALLDQDEPPPDLADRMPSDYADTTRLLMELTATFGADDWTIPPDVVDRFADPDTAGAFSNLADAIERDCGPSESVEAFRAYSQISELAIPDAQPEYCDQLSVALSWESNDEASAAALPAAIALAPPEHAAALATIEQVRGPDVDELAGPSFATHALIAIAGLGLYDEARCGVTGSFATMLFTGALVSAFGGTDGGLGGGSPSGLGNVPEPADPTPATAALPPDSVIAFEVIEIDLDGEGDYLVSAVVPAGWERGDSMFGSKFEPVDGFGVFTEITIDDGCDGLCEVTDWQARLTGPDGFITQYRADELIVDRPTERTPGIVMTKTGFTGGIEGVVIRWDDTADRYFVCDFRVEDDDVAYADAFVAACEAASPGWITGA